jgi:hypothetical protein
MAEDKTVLQLLGIDEASERIYHVALRYRFRTATAGALQAPASASTTSSARTVYLATDSVHQILMRLSIMRSIASIVERRSTFINRRNL